MTPEQTSDWKWLSTSPTGRRILAQLLREFGDSADHFAQDPLKTAYALGRASATTTIRQHLGDVSKTLYFELMLESERERDLTRKNRAVEGQA